MPTITNITLAKFFRTLLSGITVYGVLLATPVHARTLVNLTPIGASILAGNLACPDQPYFRYVGGKPDLFSGPADPAFPSPDLVTLMTTPIREGGIVNYDVLMNNGVFGDSFNLQNTRSVCYAVIRFGAKDTGDIPGNDSLSIGHVGVGGSPFTTVARVDDPGFPPLPVIQTYAFTAAGRALLSGITGGTSPLDSVLDVHLQDDTKIDFIQLWVWYDP